MRGSGGRGAVDGRGLAKYTHLHIQEGMFCLLICCCCVTKPSGLNKATRDILTLFSVAFYNNTLYCCPTTYDNMKVTQVHLSPL